MFQTVPIAGTYPRDSSEKAFDLVAHVLLGIFLWEWANSLDFDWQYISRKKPFLWPLTFYFLNRYFMLFSISTIMIGVGVTSKMNCQAVYNFDIFLGASAIGLASVNLSLRTMAVWAMKWWIVTPLVILIFGHFGLLLHAVTISGKWVPGKGCITTYANGTVLMATFIYTLSFDFIILSLMAIRLYKTSTSGTHSRLRNLIFRDGLIYFIIVFLMNVVGTTVISLHRNPAISIITSPPSAIMSTIVACRVVRRLHNYSPSGSTRPTTTRVTAPLAFKPRSDFSTFATDGIHSSTKDTPRIVKFAEAGKKPDDGPDHEPQAIHRRPI